MVAGRFVKRHGVMTYLDTRAIVAEAQQSQDRISDRARAGHASWPAPARHAVDLNIRPRAGERGWVHQRRRVPRSTTTSVWPHCEGVSVSGADFRQYLFDPADPRIADLKGVDAYAYREVAKSGRFHRGV